MWLGLGFNLMLVVVFMKNTLLECSVFFIIDHNNLCKLSDDYVAHYYGKFSKLYTVVK